jgi:hypothetical protein
MVIRNADPGSAAGKGTSVDDDMRAIFGADMRTVGDLPFTRSRRRTPRHRVGAAVTALLACAIGLGVLAGTSVPTTPRPQPFTARRPHANPSPMARAADLRASGQQAPVSEEALAAAASPKLPAAAPIGTSTKVDDAAPARSTLTDTRTQIAAPRVQSVAWRKTEPRTTICDDACVADRLDGADRSLAEVFEQAELAGVKRRLLRGYEREWDRARVEADDRPDEAMRLFGMITSDLRTLAREAAEAELE